MKMKEILTDIIIKLVILIENIEFSRVNTTYRCGKF